jgi:hypothetical protein
MNLKHYAYLLLPLLFQISCQPAVGSPAVFTSTSTVESPDNTVEPVEMTATPEPTQDAVINPLTGLKVEDPALLERRPVMVKVSNYPQYGRPHAGLSFADIVFEYFIGYGQNRFLALYYGQDCDQIGPVRSGRFIDAELVPMYSGILAYGSADEDTDAEIISRLGDYAISNLEAPEPAFVGTDTHSVTGVFANSAALTDFVNEQGLSNGTPDLHGMTFSTEIPNHGKIANQLNVLFNYNDRGEWHYDSASGKYLRWIEYFEDENDPDYDMIPLVDRVTGNQLAFSNVIILFAKYTELAPSRHTVDIWGNDKGKPAYFFRSGQVFEGTWRAKNDADPIEFFNDSGEPMELKPGNSWIVITGLNSSYKEIESGEWEMFFMLP